MVPGAMKIRLGMSKIICILMLASSCLFCYAQDIINGPVEFQLELSKPGVTSFYFYNTNVNSPESDFAFDLPQSTDISMTLGVFYQIYPDDGADTGVINFNIYFIPYTAISENWDTGDAFMLEGQSESATEAFGLNMDYSYSGDPNVQNTSKSFDGNRNVLIPIADRTLSVYSNKEISKKGLHSGDNAKLKLTVKTPNGESAFQEGVYSGYAMMVLEILN